MVRQLMARLSSPFGQQRRLFLLVFLWTCFCLLVFKATLRSGDARAEVATAQTNPRPAALVWSADYDAATPPHSVAPPPPRQQHQQHQQQQQQQQARQHQPAPPSSPDPADSHQEEASFAGSTCHYDYPNLFDLQFNNVYWQKMSGRPSPPEAGAGNATTSSPPTYYLYNAYYDDRWRGGLPSVRVLAMIDRVQPPPTNCLLWSRAVRRTGSGAAPDREPPPQPIISKASFVYAWYPKWGNYKDGIPQPWIVTCRLPRERASIVPDSVSLVEAPPELFASSASAPTGTQRTRRDLGQQQVASMAMPAAYSSSSSSSSSSLSSSASSGAPSEPPPPPPGDLEPSKRLFDCRATLPITNNLPVFNRRPQVKHKFAVCVKGLDFPHEDVSVRLVEWIEMLHLLGAHKIFLYNLDVHENISKVLHYYQRRGLVDLSQLTLPGDQPNLPDLQHLYLKSKLTAKRQNELIPYNDCLYRNLYSYQYLALLDIDEVIMPLGQQRSWFELMEQVERDSLIEQNYSRASYNVRNVYFFDDLAGPMRAKTDDGRPPPVGLDAEADERELGIPAHLHMMQHVYRSKNYTKPGQYVKCFHNTERVVSLHNHFPMNCFGQCTTYSIPVRLAHLQHYRKDCVGPLKQSCKNDFRVFTTRDTTVWKYKQQMIRRTTRVLNRLGLLGASSPTSTEAGLPGAPVPAPEPPPLADSTADSTPS